jgi:probable HAF family extracellular repeat protein
MKAVRICLTALIVLKLGAIAIAAPVYRVQYLGFTNINGIGYDINNKGQLTGIDVGGNDFAGFIRNYRTYDTEYLKGLRSSGYTLPAAINDAGQVAGNALDANYVNRGVLYTGGEIVDLGVLPGYTRTAATGINALGDVIGYSYTSSNESRAFLYQDGSLKDLGPGIPFAINASGIIVGTLSDRAVKYENGAVIDLGDFGDSRLTSAVDVNESGQILGRSYVLSGSIAISHPFVYEDGVWRDLGLPPGVPLGIPIAINNRGEVIGNSNGSQGASNRPPFLYSNGAMHNLQSLLDESGNGLTLQLVYDIDDYGRIYAQGSTNSGYRAVLLVPVPEPVPEPSPWLFAVLFAAFVVTSRGGQLLLPEGSAQD